jgi:beta-glucosidase
MNKIIYFLLYFWIVIHFGCDQAEKYDFPFRNPDLPLETRLDDLLGRLTLEEKVMQMVDQAPELERLGIPAYGWWNEGLHGVARAGIATVFPQAIGLAATFNPDLMYKIAEVISTEARAKHHHAARQGDYSRYKGLTFWSPNINIFRDPRWGRGHETYGEDPFLTARMGVAFVKGLQGNDPNYLKVIATPKHFAVHSGPEPERHEFDAVTNERDLWETYLPAFESTIKEAGAFSVMCAYNRYQGEACCGSNTLLNQILRNQWGFNGYVVSDCGAIRDIHQNHQLVDSPEEAAALAVRSGTDLNCGKVFPALLNGYKKGLITENEIDAALRRLFSARFKLGMMDPPERVTYANIPYSVNDSEEHRQLNLRTARESIVLLKNENQLLPISSSIKKIAVIGPNANNLRTLLGNYFGFPSYFVTPLEGIRKRAGDLIEINYSMGCNLIGSGKPPERIDTHFLESNGKPGLWAEYYNNIDLRDQPVYSRQENWVDDNWIKSGSVPGIGRNDYSVRWTGMLIPERSGQYLISITADDGFRLAIDDKLIIDEWQRGSTRTRMSGLDLIAGRQYKLKLEYFQGGSDAAITLEWLQPGSDPEQEALSMASQSDLIVFVGGLSALLEGEEREVPYPGFYGGDRTDLKLPMVQENLLKKISALGKPVVFVLCSGSAVAINWANDNIPAIVQLWYSGAEGGTALADVLFGDYNPAGRLPVTFYKSVNQLPAFDDYNMKNRTYRYFQDQPLYPFGHGLSYSTFLYENPICNFLSAQEDSIAIEFDITNTSGISGDEVIQIYARAEKSVIPVSRHSLIGIKRLSLNPGEKRHISMAVSLNPLKVFYKEKQQILKGGYTIFIGGGQPGFENKNSNCVKTTFKY